MVSLNNCKNVDGPLPTFQSEEFALTLASTVTGREGVSAYFKTLFHSLRTLQTWFTTKYS